MIAYSRRLFVRPMYFTIGIALSLEKNHSQLNIAADKEVIPAARNMHCMM